MGAGKGKTQRMKAETVSESELQRVLDTLKIEQKQRWSLTDAALDTARWREFIEKQGVEKVSVYSYYFSQPLQNNQISDAEGEFVLKEIFTDAVHSRTIKLPPGVDPKDFDFKLEQQGVRKVPGAEVHITCKYVPANTTAKMSFAMFDLSRTMYWEGDYLTMVILNVAVQAYSGA